MGVYNGTTVGTRKNTVSIRILSNEDRAILDALNAGRVACGREPINAVEFFSRGELFLRGGAERGDGCGQVA